MSYNQSYAVISLTIPCLLVDETGLMKNQSSMLIYGKHFCITEMNPLSLNCGRQDGYMFVVNYCKLRPTLASKILFHHFIPLIQLLGKVDRPAACTGKP